MKAGGVGEKNEKRNEGKTLKAINPRGRDNAIRKKEIIIMHCILIKTLTCFL